MIFTYGIGGTRVVGLGRVQPLGSRALAGQSAISGSVRRERTASTLTVAATGSDLKPLIRWIFFVVVATAVVSTFMNITQFATVDQTLTLENTPVSEALQRVLVRGVVIASAMALLTALVGFAAARVLSRMVADSLEEVSTLTGRIAAGATVDRIAPSGRIGIELARIYSALQVFYDTLQEVSALRSHETEMRAERDRAIRERVEDVTGALRSRIESFTQTIAAKQAQIVDDSREVVEMVEAVRTASSASVESVEHARANLEASDADLSRLVDQVHLASEKTEQTQSSSVNAVEVARTGNDEVLALESDAASIGNVVDRIRDVAAQIDLLAVNAAIEAARAGRAGAGFAVVAREVKKLSVQAGQATHEVGSKIEAIRKAVPRSAGAFRQVFQRLEEISRNAEDSASSFRQQESSARGISANTTSISGEIRDVAQRMGSLAQDVQRAFSIADRLQQAAGQTSEVIAEMEQTLINDLAIITQHTAGDDHESPADSEFTSEGEST